MNHAQFWGGAAAAPYEIEQSLRFIEADNNVLTRNVTTEGNRTTWTFSCWVKRCELGQEHMLFSAATGAHASNPNITYLSISSGERLVAYTRTNTTTNFYLASEKLLRDPSAWYHIVWEHDTTQSTAADRIKLYVNGVQITAFNTNTTPSQNFESFVNNTVDHTIGEEAVRDRYGHEGYLAEIHFVDGTALDATSFGEFDDNGVWRPIRYTGSHGSQGYYLKFDPSATNGVGHDHSGNGNNFTATGFTTSGTGTDVMSDTPTTNYATLNPLWYRNTYGLSTLSNGNLEFSDSGISTSWGGRGSTFEISSGKWYMEWKCTDASGQNLVLAVLNTGHHGLEHFMVQNPQSQTGCWGPQENGSSRWIILNGTQTTSGAPYYDTLNGQIVGIAIDADAGTATWYRNGTAITSLTDVDISASSKDAWVVMGITSNGSGTSFVANFGQRAFEQTPPTGYSAWNTSNLPAPDIADGTDYFTTLAYSGTSTTDSKVIEDSQGNDWAPDFVWLKKRNSGANHMLYDRVRGASKSLRTNTTGAEVTGATNGDLTAFTSNGFTLNSGNDVNASGNTYVAWNWLAGNGTSTPSGGSIASTVSANPSAGFSIVSYVGTFAAETIAHGLGNAPSMIITKSRDTADRWQVYHSALGNGYTLRLEETTAAGADSGAWNSTSPTSTVFSVGASVRTNRSGDDFIAYCFTEVEGYSKFGKYTANQNADGPFVWCGFKPAWVLIKAANMVQEWVIVDNARNSTSGNPADKSLVPNANWAEGTGNDLDFLSNGFKVRVSGAGVNYNSGQTYIFAAFAENPFGGDGVSPATAR